MPNKTITKNLLIVIFSASLCALTAACGHNPVSDGKPPSFDKDSSVYGEPREKGRITSGEITESSGIAASLCQSNVLWTHNDSGDGPFIYGIDHEGNSLGTFKVENASNVDWEDIAAFKDATGKCFLYVGDIGNGRKDPRGEHKIYRFPEPTVSSTDSSSSRKEPISVAGAQVLTFAYPDERQDSETLMVRPGSGEMYVVTKHRNKAAGVYRIRPEFGGGLITAERIAEITVPAIPNGFLTGGDISPDGKRAIVCDYFAAYEFVLPEGSTNFDDVWKQRPISVNISDRSQGEAIAYSADGSALFVTSEGRFQHLIEVPRVK